MKPNKLVTTTILILLCLILSCGGSKKKLSFGDIPHYPASAPGQSMDGSSFGGMVGGELTQLFTSDPFDAVVEFYSDELDKYNPEIISHATELGRQTAITIKQEKKVITVAIQEHSEEKKVVITHMIVGS